MIDVVPTLAEMAVRLDMMAMVLAKDETGHPWHHLEPDRRNQFRTMAREILVESEAYLRGVWERRV